MTDRNVRRPALTAPRILVAAVLAALVVAGQATPSAAGAAARYKVVLSTSTDFVAQKNFVQCVGASMQMMVNIVAPKDDRTSQTQLKLQELAREYSGPSPRAGFVRQGASVRGWTAGLNVLGVGPYRLVGEPSLEAALRTAARAIRDTGKPVGLLVWRGRHAWVMSGFEATADPRTTDDFDVTRAVVLDPLYPYGSSVWGPSPKPGASLTPAQLGQQFVRRNATSTFSGGSSYSLLAGMYVLVLPYQPTPLAERGRAIL